MASITLTRLFINLASTGQVIAAPSAGAESDSGIDGAVRTYAGGRQRFVGREGTGGQLERTLLLQPVTIAILLESWVGQTVFVRDVRGQSWWGVFARVKRRAVKGSDNYHLTITVNLVTQEDGV